MSSNTVAISYSTVLHCKQRAQSFLICSFDDFHREPGSGECSISEIRRSLMSGSCAVVWQRFPCIIIYATPIPSSSIPSLLCTKPHFLPGQRCPFRLLPFCRPEQFAHKSAIIYTISRAPTLTRPPARFCHYYSPLQLVVCMLEPGHYIVRDLAYGRYIGRSTIEENTWDPKPIYSLDDLEVLCSGYPLVGSHCYASHQTLIVHCGIIVGSGENPTTRFSIAD